MTETFELSATSRDSIGKANRKLAGSGHLAAVLYGSGAASKPIALDRHAFELLAKREGLTSSLIALSVDGDEPVRVIAKSIQHDPVKGTIIHVDLWAVNLTQKITTTVPVHFLGESPGVRAGGIMMHNVQQIHVEALPADLPDFVEADISGLEIGDSVHVTDLTVKGAVTILDADDEIVCSVVPPKAEEVEEVVEEEAAEPEVIGEKPATEE